MTIKFWLIRIFFSSVFLVLAFNIYNLQIEKGDYYTSRANAREEALINQFDSRGLIYFTDKNNNFIPAVLNKEYPLIYAVPKEISDPIEVAENIYQVVNINKADLIKMLSKPNDLYELLVAKGSSEQVGKLKELDIKGIYIRNENFRFYPLKEMAANLLGFISPSDDGKITGRYGLELMFNNKLSGADGEDNDVQTTIDRNIQAEGEKIISNLVKEWNADSGSIIVQEPSSGKILAMGNYPNFDPNNYSEYKIKDFINPTVQSVYEPGSVFKIITMSAGIDSGKITPQTTYYDSGSVTLNKRTINNWDLKSHGTQTMTEVIEKSLNTGTVFAEKTMGHSVFTEYVKKFGFGEKTNLQLPGEVKGSISNLEKGKDINYATASFGQGISVTPIEMVSAVSAIANGGNLLKPLILADEKIEVVRQVISKETSQKITNMMVSAVFKNVLAEIPNYLVAGKTGTAFIPDFKNGGYTDRVINTYVGFAPASNPRFTILVKLDNPSGAPLAGTTVVPSFKKMAEYLLNYFEVAPDDVNH